jgi:hypothetical protein
MQVQTFARALRVVGSASLVAFVACHSDPMNSTPSAIASALVDATGASGTLMCAPTQPQLGACEGKGAGEGCSFDNRERTIEGTCRTTLDGSAVACAPNPPPPPPELVEACAGKSAGEACTAPDRLGGLREGVCVLGRDGATILCGRARMPPPEAIEACSQLAAGDACSMPARAGSDPRRGVCSLGPAGTGPLACAPPQEALPRATEACVGRASGDACALTTRDGSVNGTCTTPASGGEPVCVVECGAAGRPFHADDPAPRPDGGSDSDGQR